MAKVRFTKEHFDKMVSLAATALLSNVTVNGKLGQPLNIVELMHTTTINSLNEIRISLGKQIEKAESQDEWVASSDSQAHLESLKMKKDLVNFIIGWKRHNLEVEETKKKKSELISQLKELQESQKTPEDRIKEIESELASLDTEEF